LERANDVLNRAEDSVTSSELILSFLEGASVLIAVALGSAAIYGFRQTREVRRELDEQLKELRDEYRSQLDQVSGMLGNVELTRQNLLQAIHDVSILLLTDQEFRLNNYQEAYNFAEGVLEHDPSNLSALYIAGWMEANYLRGDEMLKKGIRHLEHAMQRATALGLDWPNVQAAYGVALRHLGMSLKERDDDGYKQLLFRAEGELRAALGKNPVLLGLNRESYWGALGGILRDTGRLDEAIQTYRDALKMTPGSSYPQGNLANLMLRKLSQVPAEERAALEAETLDAFRLTVQFAESELAEGPGNFYLLMDIAMAKTILLHTDSSQACIDDARMYFERGLALASSFQLEVSARGWQFLFDSCPQDWEVVQRELRDRLQAMENYLESTEK
ncbi:MAG: hypothetical protein GYB66_06820, partial [Chloroflexi bacterium]|nr:hypothetical protein [Chloroflexota bacterium]